MNVAFYAPLKPPDHPTPSGDRAMARMLLRGLKLAGCRVTLASRLRSYERDGDARVQARIRARGERAAVRLLTRLRAAPADQRPAAWLTYHLYHKAPDHLGPAVTGGLGIPYLVAEASHAPKQSGGPWDEGYRLAAAAMRRAARVICLNPNDEPCVRALLGGNGRLWRLAPFIDARASARRAARPDAGAVRRASLGLDPEVPLLVTVAMKRDGAKLASYRLLGAALARIAHRPWQLLVIGDGPARVAVDAALAPLGPRVRHAGTVAPRELPAWLAAADLHLWPAVDEAWGMAFIEAAAAGLPSVAGAEGGVGAVVRDGITGLLVPARDPDRFAGAVAELLDQPDRRRAMGEAARRTALAEHDLVPAAAALRQILDQVAGG